MISTIGLKISENDEEFHGNLSEKNVRGDVHGMAISLRERSRQETRGKFDHPDITPILCL